MFWDLQYLIAFEIDPFLLLCIITIISIRDVASLSDCLPNKFLIVRPCIQSLTRSYLRHSKIGKAFLLLGTQHTEEQLGHECHSNVTDCSILSVCLGMILQLGDTSKNSYMTERLLK